MEQEPSNIDAFFKQKLLDLEPVPPERIWENVRKELNHAPEIAKAQHGTRYYMVAASVALVTTVGCLYWFTSKEKASSAWKNESSPNTLSKTVVKQSDNHKVPQASEVMVLPPQETPKVVAQQATTLHTIATTDKKQEFFLPDGSKVYLNKNGLISYDFHNKREVTLLKGEAFFEVAKKHKHPFLLKSNYSMTEVLGTSFMLRSNPEEKKDEIYVLSGRVAFRPIAHLDKQLSLGPAEKGSLDKEGVLTRSAIEERNYCAWKTEEIVFDNTPLGEVIVVLEHYYGVSLHTSNPEILTCHFTGRFEKSSLNEIVEVLAATFNLSFNDKEGIYALSGKGCN